MILFNFPAALFIRVDNEIKKLHALIGKFLNEDERVSVLENKYKMNNRIEAKRKQRTLKTVQIIIKVMKIYFLINNLLKRYEKWTSKL